MTAELGNFSLVLAFLLTAYASIFSIVGARINNQKLIRSCENAVFGYFALFTLGAGLLIHAFVTGNFQLRYVYEYSDRALPMFYKVAAFWAGQEGSMFMWVWFLSLFTMIVIAQNRKINRRMMPYITGILSIVSFFFASIMIRGETNPFDLLPMIPFDGKGLNPLLQNLGMTWHPPSLYLGYVGFTIPFAFALAAMITGNLNDLWIRSTRRWTLFAWTLLTAGIILGGQWAYVELGWGGYWAWDPVENASFMPWISGTAYLHSVMIQERKDMLKVWNMVLIILTFVLTIYGTFITRSGVISSVHSFGVSSLGPIFGVFLLAVMAVTLTLLFNRLKELKSDNELDSLLSRESMFLYNNLVLVAMLVIVFFGTSWPFISEAVLGQQSVVTSTFYNQTNVPIGLALLLVMAFCPLIAWRKSSVKNLRENFVLPTIIMTVSGVLLFITGIREGYPLTSFCLCVFVLATIIIEVVKGARARYRITGEPSLIALYRLIWKGKRRYGGYIVHIGVILVFIGITGSSAYQVEKEITVRPGESFQLGEYNLRYVKYSDYESAGKLSISVIMEVYKAGRKIDVIYPQKDYWKKRPEQPTTEVAISWDLRKDIYIILNALNRDGSATFKAVINPLVVWLWIGGIVMAIGSTIAIWPDKREKLRLLARFASEVSA
ncbi:MAG: heme lyase CcmF/NrfE family subunit [bacterium]